MPLYSTRLSQTMPLFLRAPCLYFYSTRLSHAMTFFGKDAAFKQVWGVACRSAGCTAGCSRARIRACRSCAALSFKIRSASHTVEYDLVSELDLPHMIDLRALCGANLVTLPSKFGGIATFELHHADALLSLSVPGHALVPLLEPGPPLGAQGQLEKPLSWRRIVRATRNWLQGGLQCNLGRGWLSWPKLRTDTRMQDQD